MFFSNRIKSISPSDKVLEIGPGANPFHRSDVFLELNYDSEIDEQAQFGNTGKLNTDKKIVYYDGEKFPFEDHEFDYIICSHVLEHVENIPLFLTELFRVGKKGYLEYPNIYYDYLFNFDVHKNFLRKEPNELKWMKKSFTNLDDFKIVQNDLYNLLNAQHFKLFIQNNHELLFEGYEWHAPFAARKCDKIDELVLPRESKIINSPIQFNLENLVEKEVSFKTLFQILFNKTLKKIKLK